MAGPGDDPGQDGIHGEDAGGEGEAEPQCEEGGDAEPETLVAEGGRQLILLAAGRGRRGRIDLVMRWFGDEGLDGDPLVGRGIAEAVGAALIADLEAGLLARLGQGDGDLHLPVIDLGLAEEVVFMIGAGGQHRLLEGEVLALEAEAVAVEVVVVGDAQAQQQPVALLFALEDERLVHFQKFGLGAGLDAEGTQQIRAAGPGRQ